MNKFDKLITKLNDNIPNSEITSEESLKRIKQRINENSISYKPKRSPFVLVFSFTMASVILFLFGFGLGKQLNKTNNTNPIIVNNDYHLEMIEGYFGTNYYNLPIYSSPIHNIDKYYATLIFYFGYDDAGNSSIAYVAENLSTLSLETLHFYVNNQEVQINNNGKNNTGCFKVDVNEISITVKNNYNDINYEINFQLDLKKYENYVLNNK